MSGLHLLVDTGAEASLLPIPQLTCFSLPACPPLLAAIFPALLPLVWHFAPSTLDYIGLSTGIPWSWKSSTPSTVLTFSAINYTIVPHIIWYNVGLSGWVEWYKLICCNCWNTETDQFVHMIWSIVVQWRWDIGSSGHRKSIGLGS